MRSAGSLWRPEGSEYAAAAISWEISMVEQRRESRVSSTHESRVPESSIVPRATRRAISSV